MSTAPRIESSDAIDRLGSQTGDRAMTAYLRRHPELWAPETVESIYDRVVRVARADLRQAERLASAATWLAGKLKDDRCRAQSLRATGHVLLIRGRYSDALAKYDAALVLFRALGREIDVGRTLSGGALQSRIHLGLYEEALSTAQEARQIFERHGDRLRLARLDTNLGNMLYRQNRYPEALALYQAAQPELAKSGEPQDVAAVLSNMAVCYTNLNDFQHSLDTYREARQYCETHRMPLLVAQADYNIAYLHYLRGEYTQALELYRAAEEQSERVGDTLHRALCDLDRSEIYLELNLNEEADDLAGRALARFDKLAMPYEAAKALSNLGVAASHEGQSARAIELFGRARALFRQEGNQVRLALIDFYQALVLYRDRQPEEVGPLCRTALELFDRASLPAKGALCTLLLARLALDAGDYRTAEQECAAALERVARAHSPLLSYQAHFVLGLIREAQHELSAAHAAFEAARGDLERLRGHLRAEEQKIGFLKDKLAVYEGLFATGLALGSGAERQEAAFGYVEQAKSRSLADLIACRASGLAPRVESELGDEVRQLREQVNWFYRQIELEEVRQDRRPTRRIETLHQRARTLEQQLARSLAALATTDEGFAALQNGAATRLDEIRSALAPGTLVLEYYQARGRLYACVLGREQLDVVPLAEAESVRALLGLLQFQLSKFRLGAGYAETFAARLRATTHAHLRELYAALIAPVRDRLQADHLVIVPHDVLHYVPFHALTDGASALIDQFTISFAPSASVYRLCDAMGEPSDGEPLVMGVPDARTPHIPSEIQAVAQLFPEARVFNGKDATAERLRTIGKTSRLVHIATHGLFRRDNPMFSSIRLGDGPLSVFDLYQLRLSAELVTLSGCSTGLSAVVGGDELLGLTRGLLYAGARSVLLTLWDASDQSTADFMKVFYGCVQTGSTKAKALQVAMQQIRNQYPHPFFWAPFVLIGKPA